MAGTDEFAVGDRILGKLRIDGVLGEGGMGTVYRAYHEVLACPVALKVIRAGSTDASLIERFVREVRVCALLQNEHVARVMDAGVLDGGSPYMIMELLQGRSLGDLQKLGERFSQSNSIDLVLQAMEGLAEAHAKGVVHRDVKPDNLFLAMHGLTKMPPWTVKVLDFGISKADLHTSGRQSPGTEATAVLGTPEYMSPEQLKSSRSVDSRADVWSLGVILYELLSGRRPFLGDTAGAVFASILQDEAPSLAKYGVPPDLAKVVASCLDKDIEARPHNLEALARGLAPYCSPAGRISLDEIASLRARRVDMPEGVSPTDATQRPSDLDRRLIPTRITSTNEIPTSPDTVASHRRNFVGIGAIAFAVIGALIGGIGMWKLAGPSNNVDPSNGSSFPEGPNTTPTPVPTPLPPWPPPPPLTALPLIPTVVPTIPAVPTATPLPAVPSSRPPRGPGAPGATRPAPPAPLATDRHQF
jgi:serine/threonine protein kinase